ncbi:hypothetical protein BaRGS_00034448, partial [Batillaria attramentaria]
MFQKSAFAAALTVLLRFTPAWHCGTSSELSAKHIPRCAYRGCKKDRQVHSARRVQQYVVAGGRAVGGTAYCCEACSSGTVCRRHGRTEENQNRKAVARWWRHGYLALRHDSSSTCHAVSADRCCSQ